MKKLLIIADGIVAKKFLDRVVAGRFELDILVISKDFNTGLGLIIDEKEKSNWESGDGASEMSVFQIAPNCRLMRFDATSLSKLKVVLGEAEFEKAIVSMPNELESVAIRDNLASINPRLEVDILDFWGIRGGAHTRIIDAVRILSSRLIDFIPEVPVIADNIGLGEGEIMEVRVPVGSSFAYRRIGSIRKKRWKISMIYRAGEAIVAGASDFIMPEDTLLIVGEPKILQSVFRAIKKEPGQFPSPFGSSIFVPLDMRYMSSKTAWELAGRAIYLHNHLKSKSLVLMVINPSDSDIFERLKELQTSEITVMVDYHRFIISKEMLSDIDAGLIIAKKNMFKKRIKLFYDLGVPVLKSGDGDLKDIKDGVIIGSINSAEMIGSVAIDCCKQLDLSASFYHFSKNSIDNSEDINEHFSSYSKIFNKSVRVINSVQNPLLLLRKRGDLMQFVPFEKGVMSGWWRAIFSRDVSKLSYILGHNYQLFVPVNQ